MSVSPAPEGPQALLRTWLLGALFVVAALGTLMVASPVFVPIFMAIFIAAVLRAPVRGLTQFGLPQVVAALIVFLTFAGALVSLTVVVYDPASKWVSEVPKLMERVEDKLTPLRQTLKEASATAQKIEDATELAPNNARPVQLRQPPLLERVFQQSRIVLVQIAVVAVLAFFMLANSNPVIPTRFLASFGASGRRLRHCLHQVERQMSRYMGITTLVNLCLGTLTGIAMFICDIPNPVFWAVLTTILSFIPYVGPIIIGISIGGAAFLTFDTWPQIIAPIAAYLTLHITESEFVTPMLLGRILTLHPVTIFISVLIWGWMWGLSGAFLAVPILVAISIIGRNLLITEKDSLSDLMFPMNWNELVIGPAEPEIKAPASES